MANRHHTAGPGRAESVSPSPPSSQVHPGLLSPTAVPKGPLPALTHSPTLEVGTGVAAQVWLPRLSRHLGTEDGFVVASASAVVRVPIKPFPRLGQEKEAPRVKVTRLLTQQRH